MNTRLSISIYLALVAGAGLVLGCHHSRTKVRESTEVVFERGEQVPAPPPRQVIVERSQPAPEPAPVIIDEPPPPTQEVIIIREAPPPVIVETVPPPPVVGMIWVNGYWVHDHGHYAWCRGRYVRPVPGGHFEPARWEHGRRGWEFHHERWAPREGRRGHR